MRRSRATIICLPVGTVLIAIAGWLVLSGIRLRRAFEHERVTPLVELPIDLSNALTIEIPVHVSYPAGHGFKLLIKGPPTTPETFEPEPWLDGLTGTVTVVAGPEIPEQPSQLNTWQGYASGPDSCAIGRVYGSTCGDYILRLEVSHGAAALEHARHKLVIMNDVCGCELLGVFWGNFLAVPLTIFALAALGIAFSSQCAIHLKESGGNAAAVSKVTATPPRDPLLPGS